MSERGVAVPDAIVDEWRQEVNALPMRKRGKWKSWLEDKHGQRTRVRYVPDTGHFENFYPTHVDPDSPAPRGVEGSKQGLGPCALICTNQKSTPRC